MDEKIFLTIYSDAVKVEFGGWNGKELVAWVDDEPNAIAAAFERLMMRSAIMPELRKAPCVSVVTEYRKMKSGREPEAYKRATKTNLTGQGRRLVPLPCASAKPWMTKNGALL